MRCSLIYGLAGLVAFMLPVVTAIPSSSSLSSKNEDFSVDDLSYPLLAKEDIVSDPELPPPSDIDGPRFLTPPSLVNQSPPSKPWLVERAIISLSGHANSTSDAEGSPLGAIAKGGGRATGISKTTGDPTPYTYLGCFQETNPKILVQKQSPGSMNSIMTIQVCQAFCAVYPYYGLEYFHECYCGTTPNPAAVKVTPDATYCTTSCDGNSTQKCGGAGYMSLYNDPSVPGPNDPPVFDNSNLVACYQEMASGQPRVLDSPFSAQGDSMSLQYCSDYCRSHNLPYWGLEYANQCYCSAAITANSVVRPQSECSLGCAGNEGQLCGGNDRVIVYHRNS